MMEPLYQPEEQGRPGSRSFWPLLFIISVVALIAVVSFGAGIVAERYVFGGPWLESGRLLGGLSSDDGAASDSAFPRQAEIRGLIEDEYFFLPASPEAQSTFWADLEQGAVDGMAAVAATPVASLDELRRELDYGAARGMTEVLADDYTVFLEPLRGQPLRDELAGEYEGIGIWVEHPEGQFTIVAPIAGSPAARADLRPGDVIIAADGQTLERLENDAAMSLIRGPAGTSVKLTMRRPGVAEPFDVTVEREAIVIPAVVYEPQADGKIALITVGIFGDNTTRELDEALVRARQENVAGIVLDLRGNGGGWVTSAQEMIGRFVPEGVGPALYQDLELADNGELISEPIVSNGETAFDIPLVVLIDGGTASASEIVAGAIRDYDRGDLIGQNTFGKGLVQRVHDFADGSSARISFARWLTPDQLPIPDEGLAPDIAVPYPPDATGDPQLERAIDVLLGVGATPTPE
ncbi:MAG: S41 family peptidase [Thermomicrobiales bacterium]